MANEFKVRKGLIVQGSGSTILDIQGSQGQLFSVTDSLSGSLFSVNDISGVPIMEVFSDNRVNLGTFNAEAIKVSGSFATMTGSLFGTASWANNATSASFATTASFTTAIVGTTNYVSKFTGTNTLGNSQIFDNGTNVGIGTTAPGARLDVRAQGALATDIAFRVRNSTDTANFLVVNGAGDVYNNGAGGINSNTFFGENVGRSTTGINNTAIGLSALRSNTTGNYNTAIGLNALRDITTGNFNTAIGLNAGSVISDGSKQTITDQSIFIGYDTRALADNQINQIVIGNGAIGLGSNSVVLGNDSIVTTALKGNVGIGTSSPTAKLHVAGTSALVSDFANIDVTNDAIYMGGKNYSGMYLEDGVASFGYSPGGDLRGVRANYTEGVWFINESGCKLGLQPVDNNLWSEGNIIQTADAPSNKAEPVAWIKIYNNDNSSFYFMPVYQ